MFKSFIEGFRSECNEEKYNEKIYEWTGGEPVLSFKQALVVAPVVYGSVAVCLFWLGKKIVKAVV